MAVPRISAERFCALAALVLAPTTAAAPLELSELLWGGDSVSLDRLRATADEESLEAISEHLARYEDWIREHDYVVALSEDLRVILITADQRSSTKRMKLVEKALESFDAHLMPPDRTNSEEEFVAAEWGVGDHVPDAEPVVLIEVDREDRYRTLVEGIGLERPQLASWAAATAAQPGFAEEQVCAAAWQTAPDGYELGDVWRPENELVNRLARLLVHRSYGPQPTWLRIAVAWRVEMDVLDSIYCFPYRAEFVGIGEHSGWSNELKSSFKKRKKDPLRLEEFADWKRNTWDDERAQLAWGLVEYLARFEEGSLSTIAESFRKQYKAGSRTTHDDGTWTTNPAFQVSIDDQREVLLGAASEDVLERATEFFQKGKRYRPKKKRR